MKGLHSKSFNFVKNYIRKKLSDEQLLEVLEIVTLKLNSSRRKRG